MTALVEQEGAAVALVAAPVAHEKGTVLGMEMLVTLEADEAADAARAETARDGGDKRRRAQHQPDDYGSLAMRAQQTGQLPCLFFRAHHRLFGEDADARFEARADMIEMKMIWRTHHEEIGLRLREHLRDIAVSLAGFDAAALEHGAARGRGIGMGDDPDVGRRGGEIADDGRDAPSEARDGDRESTACLHGRDF